MPSAARIAYAPCPSSLAALAASQPPATAEGRRDREPRPWRAVDHHEILPDNHVRIEAAASELEPVDRPELVRATVRPVAAAVWLLQPPSNPVHTSRMWLRRRGVHLARRAARGGVIEDQRLELRAGYKEDGVSLNQWMWITATVAQKIGRSKRRRTSSNAGREMLRPKT